MRVDEGLFLYHQLPPGLLAYHTILSKPFCALVLLNCRIGFAAEKPVHALFFVEAGVKVIIRAAVP